MDITHISDPVINVYWTAEGVHLYIHAHVYTDTLTRPTRIYLNINRAGLNTGVASYTHEPTLMEALDNWVRGLNPLSMWEREEALYKQSVGAIELPGIEAGDCIRRLWYNVYLNTPDRAGRLLVGVEITETGAKGYLYPLNDDGEYSEECCLSEYELQYPITMDSIKAKVRGTLQQYMDYL